MQFAASVTSRRASERREVVWYGLSQINVVSIHELCPSGKRVSHELLPTVILPIDFYKTAKYLIRAEDEVNEKAAYRNRLLPLKHGPNFRFIAGTQPYHQSTDNPVQTPFLPAFQPSLTKTARHVQSPLRTLQGEPHLGGCGKGSGALHRVG